MMPRLWMGLLIGLLPMVAFSQHTSHRPFLPGERVEYKAYYNWGFIWIHAGNVRFTVNQAQHNNQNTLRLDAYGRSLKSYDWAFKVRDHFRSVVREEDLAPLDFTRDTYEGGYAVDNTYSFDYDQKKIYAQVDNSREAYREDTLDLDPPVFDVLTAIYHARTLNFANYQMDEKIPLSLVIDNEIYELYLRYQGKERIKIPKDKHYNCIKFSAMLVEGTIFSGGEHLTVWVSDDKNRIPVMVKAKILVGSVKAVLRSTHNLKYPSVLSDQY